MTVGVVGALVSVEWSLAMSSAAVVVIAAVLLAREAKRLDLSHGAPSTEFTD